MMWINSMDLARPCRRCNSAIGWGCGTKHRNNMPIVLAQMTPSSCPIS